ncbi:TonB-dependent receptor [Sphingomonas sp. ERG5]|uniref:TonB-dependent receptor n=1 Tax=Sphingomonas sp. ERG5 TaxID=1381597 RepID=UPI00054B6C0F|nr:TonB-dependent receptor [Sphingomonas sp. ERG5]
MPPANAARTVAEDRSAGDDIIVTASRRREKLQDVPGQVGTVSGEDLGKLKAKTLADFAAFTPGVSFQTSTPSTSRVAIRGITTGGTQLNSAIGLYLDDVPVGSSTPFGLGAQALNIGLFDLQRIEVLNGPQGTLYGANALGGTLKYMTNVPDLAETTGRIEGEGGYTAHGAGNGALRAMINVPLADDRVALRAVGVAQWDSGFADDPSHGRDNLGNARTLGGRVTLLAKPTPDLTIRLNAFGQRITSNGLAVSMRDPVTHHPTQGPYDQSYQLEQPSRSSLGLFSGVVDWDWHWAKLTSVTAYQYNSGRTEGDFSVPYSAILGAVLGPAAVKPYLVTTAAQTRRFTQELRLASPDNRSFEWVVGAFYSREKTGQQVNLINAADPSGRLLGIPLGSFDLPSTSREFALFGDATLYVTSKLDATFGVRYSWNHQVFSQYGSGLVPNSANPFGTVFNSSGSDEGVATYLFNLRYHVSPATMIYGRIASGYRPGGPNLITGGGTGNATFDADRLWNYEIGMKTSFAGGRGFLNTSLYHIDWSSIQLSVNRKGVNQLVNGGDARVNGAEMSLSYRLIPEFKLIASGSYTDAKLTTVAPLLGIAYVGARLPLSPRFSLAMAGDYSFDLGSGVTGDLNLAFRHIGQRNAGYPGSSSAPLYKLASYNVVDLSLNLQMGKGWEVGPYVKNLFDVRGEVSASTTANVYVPAAPVPVTLSLPRTIGLTLGRSF